MVSCGYIFGLAAVVDKTSASRREPKGSLEMLGSDGGPIYDTIRDSHGVEVIGQCSLRC